MRYEIIDLVVDKNTNNYNNKNNNKLTVQTLTQCQQNNNIWIEKLKRNEKEKKKNQILCKK